MFRSQSLPSHCTKQANSWGFDGSQKYPPMLDAYFKIQMGWATPTLITSGTVNDLPNAYENSSGQYFKIQEGYPDNEYLLIEYRKKVGYEGMIPDSGVIIYHVDTSGSVDHNSAGYPGQTGWPENGKHYKVAVLAADGDYDLEKDVGRGDVGDVDDRDSGG